MVFLKRKRLILWLLRAYIKKWGKLILISLLIFLVIFGLVYFNRQRLASFLPRNNQTIGIAGIYSADKFPDQLPDFILNKTSRGLTKVLPDGRIAPDIAKSWDIKDDGKTYIFYLKDDVYFTDGEKLNSSKINYNFEDVTVEKPAKTVIIFKLKDKYSPFLVTLANHKVFKDDLIGVSDYKINNIKSSGGFLESVQLEDIKTKNKIKYEFYPTQKALKDAYSLGTVSKIYDINNLDYKENYSFDTFKNTKIKKEINEDKIATIFFNNRDPLISDKKLRKALAYSLPDRFEEGKRTYVPYPPNFWVRDSSSYEKGIDYAKEMLDESDASKSGNLKIELKVSPPYRKVADNIAVHWKKLGIDTQITQVDGVPSDYQAYLGEFPVLKDPDQYSIWHTGQAGNITNYRNLRIDKLLEDGRRTSNPTERKNIYLDFQKYLVDDMPAAFLYFPYTYTLTRD